MPIKNQLKHKKHHKKIFKTLKYRISDQFWVLEFFLDTRMTIEKFLEPQEAQTKIFRRKNFFLHTKVDRFELWRKKLYIVGCDWKRLRIRIEMRFQYSVQMRFLSLFSFDKREVKCIGAIFLFFFTERFLRFRESADFSGRDENAHPAYESCKF